MDWAYRSGNYNSDTDNHTNNKNDNTNNNNDNNNTDDINNNTEAQTLSRRTGRTSTIACL